MYILNIDNAIKKMKAIEIKNVSFKIIINEFNFLKKTVIIQWNIKKGSTIVCKLN